MIKKLTTILLSLVMLSAAAGNVALADITLNEDYDIECINNAFENETNSGAPDGSHYKISTGEDKIWDSAKINLSSNYYLSLDFKLDSSNAEANQIIMTNKGGNVGPQFSVQGKKFRTQTGGSGYDTLYSDFDVNKWYKIELEGRMSVVGASTAFTLYEYNGSEMKQVAHSDTINLRNFSETAGKSHGYTTLAKGVCYDNEYAVQEYPNAVSVTAEGEPTELSGGDSLQFTAQATRNGSTANLTQPKIVWAVEDTLVGEAEYFSIDNGFLMVDANAAEQTVRVTATAQSNGNPVGEYTIKINEYDKTTEVFDTAEVTGSDTVKAGESSEYTFTAMKDGNEVTDLTEDQYLWKVYNSTGTRELGNHMITVENGLLQVDPSVLGQKIRVRVSTATEKVFADKEVTIQGVSKETVINENACEEKVEDDKALVRQGSWDGSSYYVKNTTDDFLTSGTLGNGASSGDILISMDLKFMAQTGSGVTTIRRDGDSALWLCSHNGVLSTQTGSSAYSDLTFGGQKYTLDSDAWYHVDLMFSTAAPSLNIWKYDADGTKIEKATFTSADGLALRKSNAFNRMKLNADTGLDNYRVVYPDPTELSLTAENSATQSPAGTQLKFTVTGSRDGLVMPNLSTANINWAVYDSDNALPTDDDSISVTAGVLSSDGLTKPQTVYVRAISAKDKTIYASYAVQIVQSKIFTMTNIGVDSEDETKVVRFYGTKNAEYSDDTVFMMTLYDAGGKLIGAYSRKMNAKNLKLGEIEIPVDYTLPQEYDKTTGKAKLMAWTSLTTREEPENVSTGFTASYADNKLTLSGLPAITGTATIAVYAPDVTDSMLGGDITGKALYTAQAEEAAFGDVVLADLPAGEYTVTVGALVNNERVVYRATFTVPA